jgi:hypothetical protein
MRILYTRDPLLSNGGVIPCDGIRSIRQTLPEAGPYVRSDWGFASTAASRAFCSLGPAPGHRHCEGNPRPCRADR